MNLTEIESKIIFDSFISIESETKIKLLKSFGSAKYFIESFHDIKTQLLKYLGIEKIKLISVALCDKYYKQVLDNIKNKGFTCITSESEYYPSSLKEIAFPPIVLYCKGNIELLKDDNKFAIVGSRTSERQYELITEEFAKNLSESMVIVTGLADGMDTAVLRGVLKGSKKVISIMPCGYNLIYPSFSKGIAEKVIKDGLILTEYPSNVYAKSHLIINRNRLFSAFSRGILIASSAEKGGALNSANHALENNKDIFAFPYNINVLSGKGCNNLIKNGANLITDYKDILEYYNLQTNKTQEKEKIIMDKEERAVYEFLLNGKKHLDQIALSTKFSIIELNFALTSLELQGMIGREGNYYFAI